MSVADIYVPVIDRHEMRFDAFVIQEPRQPSVLRHGGGCEIRLQLAGELLLKPFNHVLVEVRNAPERVYVIR
jgi:hypothetical protein